MQTTANSQKFTVLVVDDDAFCREMWISALEMDGGIVTVCGTAKQARTALALQTFDLLVLDHALPDGNGSELFYEARERNPSTTAILITGQPNLSGAVELTRNGLFDYLLKPVELPDFINAIRRARFRFASTEVERVQLDLVGQSEAMKDLLRQVKQAARNPSATVLITGETGVGKDVVAREIHKQTFADAKNAPAIVSLNCATLPAEMFEAELFGSEKGAYTGSHEQRIGLAEAANNGTLFLDEIGEVPLPLQAKLLQFLETREFRRLGSARIHRFTGRFIAATNRSLEEDVRNETFRADLYYRLDVFSINIPPLRERKTDLAQLADALLVKLADKYSRSKPALKPSDYPLLEAYSFPGNVRELRNLLERSLLLTQPESSWLDLDPTWIKKVNAAINAAAVAAPAVLPVEQAPKNLNAIEAQEYLLIKNALTAESGRIRRAAARLGLSHQALLRRLEKWPELQKSREVDVQGRAKALDAEEPSGGGLKFATF